MRGTVSLTILLFSTLCSSVGRADVSLSPSDLAGNSSAPELQRRDWRAPPRLDEAAAPARWQPTYPLLTAPQLTVWLFRDDTRRSLIPSLADLQSYERPLVADNALAGLGGSTNLRPSWPLLHYQEADGGVSLTLSPGSPCTGACLKVAGSF